MIIFLILIYIYICVYKYLQPLQSINNLGRNV